MFACNFCISSPPHQKKKNFVPLPLHFIHWIVFHWYPSITSRKVRSSNVHSWSYFCQDIFNYWYGVSVEYCYLVDFAIVHTEMKIFIFPLNQDYRWCPEAGWGLDCSQVQHLVNLLPHWVSHRKRDSVEMLSDRRGITYINTVPCHCGATKPRYLISSNYLSSCLI